MDKGISTVVDEKYFGEPFGKLQKFRNVHERGSDCAAGDVIVPSGTRLLPQHIGAAAAFGYEKIKVKRLLQVGIIATGDELVSVSALPKAHQIRLSNGHAIEAALRLLGIETVTLVHSGDSEAELRKRIIDSLEKNEILILSGGVSMGRTDYVPKILAEVGIEPLFHRIKQKPGKPFWFGRGREGGEGESEPFAGKLVFALPGNPASVLVCLYRYVLPALLSILSENGVKPLFVVLNEEVGPTQKMDQFKPVQVQSELNGTLSAQFVPHRGSGDFSNW